MDPIELNALVHDHDAADYDERFAIAYNDRLPGAVVRELSRILGDRPQAKRALDFASGTGYAAVGMAASGVAHEVHACDLSFEMLAKTRANAQRLDATVHLSLCDGQRLPYEDGSFDLVVARGALHHLPSPLDGLREIRRVLSLGGIAVVLAEPTASGEWQVAAVVGNLARGVTAWRRLRHTPEDAKRHAWELATMAANLHTFHPRDIDRLAAEAGFDDRKVSTGSWLWVLAMGLNYYAAGEWPGLAGNAVARWIRYRAVDAAHLFDRVLGDRVVPSALRHTVQAILR